MKKENIRIPQHKIELIKKTHFHDLRSILNSIQNYHNGDLLLNDCIFEKLFFKKNNEKYLNNLLLHYDISTIFCFCFNYIYEHYEIDEQMVYMMNLLLTINKSPDYFIKEFIPYVSKKLKLL